MSHNLDFRTWRINLRDIDAANLKQPPRRTFYLLQRGKEKKKDKLSKIFLNQLCCALIGKDGGKNGCSVSVGQFPKTEAHKKGSLQFESLVCKEP